MPLKKTKKKKLRKILMALDPFEKGFLTAQQVKEDLSDSINEIIRDFKERIKDLKDDLLVEFEESLKKVPDLSDEVSILKQNLDRKIESIGIKSKEDILDIKNQIKNTDNVNLDNLKGDLDKKIDVIRNEFRNRLGRLGGGNMSRQININSSVMSTRYNDINFQEFGNVGWAAVNDDDNKRVNVRASIGILAGAIDAGGATSLEIPNAAGGTTVDAAGEVTLDTTSGTINFYDGTAERVLTPVQRMGFFLETPVATDDLAFTRIRTAMTIIEVDYLCVGGTNWVGQVQEGDANGLNGVDTQTTDTTASAGTNAQVTSFSNAAIDAGDYLILKTTSISGTPTSLVVTIYFRQDA